MRTVAPHLVRPLPFLIPLDGSIARRAAAQTMAGLRSATGCAPPRARAAGCCRRRGA